ncbi:MAG: GMC oxidoreductase [Pseudomonadota bacterium]
MPVNTENTLLEAVVIGSGFGGAISFCRMAQKWQDKVLLLERGKRYPMGAFPRSPHAMATNFWSPAGDRTRRPKAIREQDLRGLYDVRNFSRMDVVAAAGLGGGSLIYANVFLEPPAEIFNRGWPSGLVREVLHPYYQVARRVLGARPIPSWNHDPRRRIVRTELFREFASSQNRTSTLADLCVFFGNDFEHPTAIGIQEKNHYGVTQTSCTYCGECDVGCNTHSKNSLDLNYLHVAEQVHKAKINTDSQVENIVPLNAFGEEDAKADGTFGYRIHYIQLDRGKRHVDTRRVVVAAGTLGTNELLLRCRDEFGSLPRISEKLGHGFSGNGDFVSFVAEGKKAADPNYGPVITQYIDYNLFQQHDRERAFILQDASYPSFVAWCIEGLRPSLNVLGFVKRMIGKLPTLWNYVVQSCCGGKRTGSLGGLFSHILKGDMSYRSSVLLCMGLDKADGVLELGRNDSLKLVWPQRSSMILYQAILASGKQFRSFVQSHFFFAMPTWLWPFRNNITVHALGGCILADSPATGVVSAHQNDRGQVFGYKGLYIADGSIVPSAIGANPAATISALAEWIAHGITQDPDLPGDDLHRPIRSQTRDLL